MGLTFKFLGTGSADGYPSPWCMCDNCQYARSRRGRNIRRSTSVLVDQKVLIDFPAEVFILADRQGLDISAIDRLVITHAHTDHFHISSFKWRCMHRHSGVLAAPKLTIHASDAVTEAIRVSLRFGSEQECGISLNTLSVGENFDCHGVEFTPLLSSHQVTNDIPYNFLIQKDGITVLYLVDSDSLLEEAWDLISGARLSGIVTECTGWDKQQELAPGHMNLEKLNHMWRRAEVTGIVDSSSLLVLTHLSHLSPPHDLITHPVLPGIEVQVAYDGFQAEFC